MIWKQLNSQWANKIIGNLIDFNMSLDSPANIFSESDKEKIRKHINSLRLIFNRYSKSK